MTCILVHILRFDDNRLGILVIRVRSGVREDVRRETDNVAQYSDGVVRLIGEEIDIGIAIAEEQVVLERAVDDSDLDNVGVRE